MDVCMPRLPCFLLLLSPLFLLSAPQRCAPQVLPDSVIDISQAVALGARFADPLSVMSAGECLSACCMQMDMGGDLDCNFLVFDARKSRGQQNCYIFHCPSQDSCPLVASLGVISYSLWSEPSRLEDPLPDRGPHSPKTGDRSEVQTPPRKTSAESGQLYPNFRKDSAAIASQVSANHDAKEQPADSSRSFTSQLLRLADRIDQQLERMESEEGIRVRHPTPAAAVMPATQTTARPGGGKNAAAKGGKPDGPSYKKPQDLIYLPTAAATLAGTGLGAAVPRLGAAVPRLGAAVPRLCAAVPRLGAAVPRLGTAAPELGTAAPELGTAAPELGTAAPRLGTATPRLGTAAPELGPAAPRLGATAPRLGTAAPRLGTAAPRLGTAAPRLGTAAPRLGTAAPRRGTAAPPPVPGTKVSLLLPPAAPQGVSGVKKATTAEVKTTKMPRTANASNNGAPKMADHPPPRTEVPVITTNPTKHPQMATRPAPLQSSPPWTGTKTDHQPSAEDKTPVAPPPAQPEPPRIPGGARSALPSLQDKSGLVAALVFGVLFLMVVVGLVGRRVSEARRRHRYTKLDYLINGMYVDT